MPKTQTENNQAQKARYNALGIVRTTLWLPKQLVQKFQEMAQKGRDEHLKKVNSDE